MPNLTIKNLPAGLYERLKEAAARERRSLNSEVIRRLERSVATPPIDVPAMLEKVRALRERTRVPYVTDETIRALRDEGRR